MKLINQQDNPAILSNVGEIGEFRIRNSAKAFNILSSGLYANKIRAIIRELSCNAVDSHVAAGKGSTPFDVHLPTQLEPWFAIRDYGTGLDHKQVTDIYTTYFESTKTDSNEFIGALGLGSKSPFSYTDNFTVTAIKDGRRGIYSAFINDKGVPSIALMMEEQTTDPNGVEVKFSVNNSSDFYKFAYEAAEVYVYFKLRPVIGGATNFKFKDISYLDRDIIAGVHSFSSGYSGKSVAVMGNIGYPINMPNAIQNLGPLANLLSCGLEMHFDIGELDFQASREGLSYVPETIAAIKTKLNALNEILATKLTSEADAIANLWDRARFLHIKYQHNLWRAATKKYVKDSQFPLVDDGSNGYFRLKSFDLFHDEVKAKYNIELRILYSYGNGKVSQQREQLSWDHRNSSGQPYARKYYSVACNSKTVFVKNDLKTGAFSRVKHYLRATRPNAHGDENQVVMSVADASSPALFDLFLKDIYSPPRVKLASAYDAAPRKSRERNANVSILKLEYRFTNNRYRSDNTLVWRDAGHINDFDKSKTHYYLPLTGYQTVSEYGEMYDNKEFFDEVRRSGIKDLASIELHGVRKADIEAVKSRQNWVNIEAYLAKILPEMADEIEKNLVQQRVKNSDLFMRQDVQRKIVDLKSKFIALSSTLGVKKQCINYNYGSMESFFQRYLKRTLNVSAMYEKILKEVEKTNEFYPLLQYLDGHATAQEISDYINLVDRSS